MPHASRLRTALRRALLLPTGRRRKAKRLVPADPTVVPPMPKYAPYVPSSAQLHDQLMQKLVSGELTITGRRPRTSPPIPSIPREKVLVTAGAPTRVITGTATQTRIIVKPYAFAPVLGVNSWTSGGDDRARVTPADIMQEAMRSLHVIIPEKRTGLEAELESDPETNTDDLLMSEDWDRIFDEAISRTDVIEVSFAPDGSVRAVMNEDTVELGKVLPDPVQEAHLCKHCGELHPGDVYGERVWRCSNCKMTDSY